MTNMNSEGPPGPNTLHGICDLVANEFGNPPDPELVVSTRVTGDLDTIPRQIVRGALEALTRPSNQQRGPAQRLYDKVECAGCSWANDCTVRQSLRRRLKLRRTGKKESCLLLDRAGLIWPDYTVQKRPSKISRN
jgi:hypothetical protein